MIGHMRGRAAVVAAIGGLATLAACGSQTGDSAPNTDPPADVVPDDYTGRFRATFITVLSSADHGPQLCAAVEESLPPQCSGPDIDGWDWRTVEHETASSTRWGEYRVVGTFAYGVFTLTEPPAASTQAEPDNDSACLEPCTPDTDHTPRELQQIANRIAADVPDVQAVWSDPRTGTVALTVWVAYEALWRQLAEEYGTDVIDLHGVLQPID
jgi:hypothetical protein